MTSSSQKTLFLLLFILTFTCNCYAKNATSIEDLFQMQLVARDDFGLARTKISKRGKLTDAVKTLFKVKPVKPVKLGKLGKPFAEPLPDRRFGAVGDLHGDLLRTQAAFERCGVVNKEGQWSGSLNTFVQVGDVIDRGPDTIELINYLEKLRSNAPKGSVFTLMGNHEFMNLQGQWGFVTPDEIKSFGGMEKRWEAILGWIGKIWKDNYITALWLPLHPALGEPNNRNMDEDKKLKDTPFYNAAYSFTHAGLSPQYPNSKPFPQRINDISRGLIEKLLKRTTLMGLAQEKRLLDIHGGGPLWYRGWSEENPPCDKVDEVLKRTRTRRMIMGHSVVPKIQTKCDGKVILIDTGISSVYAKDSRISALVIDYSVTRVGEENGVIKLEEREVIKAVYSDPITTEILLDVVQPIELQIKEN